MVNLINFKNITWGAYYLSYLSKDLEVKTTTIRLCRSYSLLLGDSLSLHITSLELTSGADPGIYVRGGGRRLG